MNILRSTSRRARAAVLVLSAASLAACGETAGPDDDVSTDEMRTVAVALEAVAAQPIFTDLFGTQMMPSMHSPAAAREMTIATREMLQVAARSVDGGEAEPANAFPDDVKGKTYVPTSSGGWAWDPALPQPGAQTARFIARNSLGQTRGHLDVTDLQAAGAVLRYRAELYTIANVRVLDYINELTETYVGTELASYTYDVDGVLSDGQTNISFDYRITESSLNTGTPAGTESYTVQVPRLDVGMTLSGTMSANGWATEYTLQVREAELHWILGADNTVRFFRNGQHLASGTWDEFDNQTYWRTPNGQPLGTTAEQFIEAADRASEAMFAPVTATLLVDQLVVTVLY